MDRPIDTSKAFKDYARMNQKSQNHAMRARTVIPSGLSRGLLRHSPFPFYTVSGSGAWTEDLDGNRRLDVHGNYTAQIHGHAHPDIITAVNKQLPKGTAYPTPPVQEAALAELLCGRIPGVQKAVFNNSGSEAVMVAIRVARAHTGRNRIGLFEGCYHGSSDAVLVGGQGLPMPEDPVRVSRPAADMAGLPLAVTTDAVLMRYNDPQAVIEAVEQYGDELAAILLEPVLFAGGVIPAQAEFINTIREETKRRGIVMICDEVVTLRQAVGGAQAYFGIVPDLTTMGKIIGGGFPVGSVGGLNEFMCNLNAPEDGGTVANLGTFSANPISMHAGLLGMKLLDEAAIAKLNRLGKMTRNGLVASIEKHHAPAQVTGTGSLFCIHWTTTPVREARVAERASSELALLTYIGLSNRGVHTSARGVSCLSTPMEKDDIERVVMAFEDTLDELQGESWF